MDAVLPLCPGMQCNTVYSSKDIYLPLTDLLYTCICTVRFWAIKIQNSDAPMSRCMDSRSRQRLLRARGSL